MAIQGAAAAGTPTQHLNDNRSLEKGQLVAKGRATTHTTRRGGRRSGLRQEADEPGRTDRNKKVGGRSANYLLHIQNCKEVN